MKVRMKKDISIAIGGVDVKHLKLNDVIDMPDEQAVRHIERGICVAVDGGFDADDTFQDETESTNDEPVEDEGLAALSVKHLKELIADKGMTLPRGATKAKIIELLQSA